MRCPVCDHKNPAGAKFCNECATKLKLICPKCGKTIPTESKFCLECGHALSKTEESSQLDYTHPRTYTPKHLADKILTSRSSLERERKVVTVLFADVANFTNLSEKLDPEDVHRIMEGCLGILMDSIHKYEGTINQFTGDGVMALFGAPLAHEDHAQRACTAALTIQKGLAEYREKIRKDYGQDFRMRIGLNSGQVVVGSIGDDLHMDYTAIGDTINLASRMEDLAIPGTVLLSRNTQRLVKEYFDLKSIGTLEVKGKEEPQEGFELIKAGGAATRLEASMARGLTRFVGRKNSMAALMEPYKKVKEGFGQIVGVVGEAGVGKSRLLLEFRHRLPQDDLVYLEGHCLHFGGTMPYLPILDLLRSYFEIKEGEHEMVLRRRVNEMILGLDPKLEAIISPVQDILSLKVEEEVYEKLEPKQRKEKVFEGLRDLFIRESQDRPLVLVVEDLHWIDKTSEEFLDYLIGWLANIKIMLILLYRPEYIHQWGNKSYFNRIGLGQLTLKSSAELVQAILEGGETAPELNNLILNRAAGNPLFMEELTHSLLETGFIKRAGDRYVLSKKSSDLQIPDTVQGIIAGRMDRLEENLKRIMQMASVIGREFAFRILQAIIDMKEDLKAQLLNLQGLEFIYEKKLFPELEYIFKHALTQEVAYNSLLLKKRKEIHEKTGQAIEELYPERLEEFYEMLAYHYSKSGNLLKAFEYLKKAGGKAIRKDAPIEGLRLYKEALGVLSMMPPTDEKNMEQIDLVLLMDLPERRIGYSEDHLPALQKAEALTEQLGDTRKGIAVRSALGIYYIQKGGDPQLGWEYLERCSNQPELIQDVGFTVSNGYDLCVFSSIVGDSRSVTRIAPTIISLLENTQTQDNPYEKAFNPYAFALGLWGVAECTLGHFDHAEKLFEKGLSFAKEINHRATTGAVQFFYGGALTIKGEADKAIKILTQAIKDLEESQTMLFLGQAWTYLGFAHWLIGKYQEGLKFAEKGLNIQTDLGLFLRSFCMWVSGLAQFSLGNLDESGLQVEQALKCSVENKEKQTEGMSRCLLGRILAKAEPGRVESAVVHIRQGISLLEKLGYAPISVFGYFWLGEVYAESYRKEEALENLKKVKILSRRMNMAYWTAKAQEKLANK